jgi:hypothetical protein
MTKTRFLVWIDGNHPIRKIVEHVRIAGQAVTMTINAALGGA